MQTLDVREVDHWPATSVDLQKALAMRAGAGYIITNKSS
jgi:hypothetical protein